MLIVFLLLATEAGAHADLVSSSPADGAALDAAPAVLQLRFSEPVRPIAVRLLDGTGRQLRLSAAVAAGPDLRIAIEEKPAEGQYTLSYRVTSLDSHPVSGSILFSVGEAKPGSAQHAVEAGSVEGVRIALRVVRDFALLLAAGGVLCLFALGRFPHDRLVLVSASLVGAAAAVLGVGMQGAALLGDADALFSAAAWRTGLQSSFGSSACVATAGLLLVASARRWLMLVGAIAALCSLSMTGHAQIAHPAAAAMFAVLVHGLAAAFWIGSLAGLWLSLRTQSVRAAALLRRFSPLGMAAVALLVAGAITLAVLQLRAPSDLATSAYGRFILVKSSLLALLIVLALINRYRLLPALERGAAGAARRLGFSIAAELVLLLLVIVVTATLVQTPPPERPHELTLESGGHTAALSVSPGRAGRNVISVRVPGAAEVTVEMANPAARIEPIVRPMARVSADDYRYQGTELAFAGTWAVTIHARIGDFEKRSFSVQLQIR